jgi:hypothetical protein
MPGDAVIFEEVSAISQGFEQDVIEVLFGGYPITFGYAGARDSRGN